MESNSEQSTKNTNTAKPIPNNNNTMKNKPNNEQQLNMQKNSNNTHLDKRMQRNDGNKPNFHRKNDNDRRNKIPSNNYRSNSVENFNNALNEEVRKGEKKFTGRCRLFVGNLPNDITEAEFKEIFSKYGEVGELFLNNSRSFGFIKLVRRRARARS